jgi:predicted nucleotidyltransferase
MLKYLENMQVKQDFCKEIKLPYTAQYLFGSRVYRTATAESDYDVIFILPPDHIKKDSLVMDGNFHYQIYTHDEWIYKIKNMDIAALECIFLPYEPSSPNLHDYLQYFSLDLNRLRESISTISNNSWTKGKKKLIISGDYDKKAALKSIFHSIRILRFGIQIARTGKIYDYKEANWLWVELSKLGDQYDSDILWEKINARYKAVFNATSSEFKALAPKDLVVRDKVRTLKDILDRYGCYSQELADEIKQVYE